MPKPSIPALTLILILLVLSIPIYKGLTLALSSLYKGSTLANTSQYKGSTLAPSTNPTSLPSSRFSVWIAWWDEATALESLKQNASHLNTILPVWYTLDSEGQIIPTASSQKPTLITLAKSQNIPISPTITNATPSGFDPDRVSRLLQDPAQKDQQIQNLIQIALESGFSGYDIDWEELHPQDEVPFSQFIKDFATALHSHQLTLSVSVHPQTGTATNSPATQAQNWKEIAKFADFVRIMAYDFHNSTTAPGPITPLDWLKDILQYATATIPPEKTVLGLPTYGYDWSPAGTTSRQYQDTINLLNHENSQWHRDPASQALTATYTKDNITHTVWFEDATSLKAKVEIAQEYGIYQFSLWRLGHEDPTIFDSLTPN